MRICATSWAEKVRTLQRWRISGCRFHPALPWRQRPAQTTITMAGQFLKKFRYRFLMHWHFWRKSSARSSEIPRIRCLCRYEAERELRCPVWWIRSWIWAWPIFRSKALPNGQAIRDLPTILTDALFRCSQMLSWKFPNRYLNGSLMK